MRNFSFFKDALFLLPLPVLVLLTLAGCDTFHVDAPAEQVSVELIAPSRITPGETMPLVARVQRADGTLFPYVSELIAVCGSGSCSGPALMDLKRGRGSLSFRVDATENLTFSLNGLDGTRPVEVVNDIPVVTYEGTLDGSQAWDASADRHITGTLQIMNGATLRIEPGTRVFLGDKVNIDVYGELTVAGTREAPVWFSALDPDIPWGGITLHRTNAAFAHALFTFGGADTARMFGHSDSQPVIMHERAEATYDHVYLFDHPGKALGARSSKVTFTNGLISRTDTGGEFSRSTVQIGQSHILDIPNGDGQFVDDDNDGLYFYKVHPDGAPSVVADTYIITGKDDAIDHNGAKLEIRNSWLEGFLNEGVAASNTNWVRVSNTVVRNCEQGIEAGYGTPEVTVDHTVLIRNDVGLRFGDSYDWGSEGTITVTNSIFVDNEDDVWNFDLKRQAPVDSAITMRFTLINDPDFEGCPNCLTGFPRLDTDFFLMPGSIGLGAGENGTDLGRIRE